MSTDRFQEIYADYLQSGLSLADYTRGLSSNKRFAIRCLAHHDVIAPMYHRGEKMSVMTATIRSDYRFLHRMAAFFGWQPRTEKPPKMPEPSRRQPLDLAV